MKDNNLPPSVAKTEGIFLERLKNAGVKNFRQEFIWLACHALNEPEYKILLKKNFNDIEYKKLSEIISRREAGEPLQYILGSAVFYGREFITGEGVLIPREDTETLIEAVKKYYEPEKIFKFLDFGTGTGCIAITLLLEYKNSIGYMLEISEQAKNYALKNLSLHGLKINERVFFCEPDECNLIISNPPYIPSEIINTLDRSVKDYEPVTALDGGSDGMNFYRMIFSNAVKILRSGGLLIFEIGDLNQAQALRDYDVKNFKFLEYFHDSSNFPRCMVWRKC